MNKTAPQDMRQHLMLNQSRLSTAEEVAQEFEDYWDATEEFFSRDDKGHAGFIAPVGKGPAKGGRPEGAIQLWKEWWHEGQRKNAQRTRISTRAW